eukprot:PhF_6_TR6316/c0_g1_i1/m.9572
MYTSPYLSPQRNRRSPNLSGPPPSHRSIITPLYHSTYHDPQPQQQTSSAIYTPEITRSSTYSVSSSVIQAPANLQSRNVSPTRAMRSSINERLLQSYSSSAFQDDTVYNKTSSDSMMISPSRVHRIVMPPSPPEHFEFRKPVSPPSSSSSASSYFHPYFHSIILQESLYRERTMRQESEERCLLTTQCLHGVTKMALEIRYVLSQHSSPHHHPPSPSPSEAHRDTDPREIAERICRIATNQARREVAMHRESCVVKEQGPPKPVPSAIDVGLQQLTDRCHQLRNKKNALEKSLHITSYPFRVKAPIVHL